MRQPWRSSFKVVGSSIGARLKWRSNTKGVHVGEGRLDLLVGGVLVVELKAVDTLLPVHKAQLLSYLKTLKRPLGLLINFKVQALRQGIQRVILSQ